MNQAEWLKIFQENVHKRKDDIRRAVMQEAPQVLFGILASCGVLPILVEASQGQFPLDTILAAVSGLGINFITERLLQSWRDSDEQALQDQLAELATNNDEVRKELNKLIKLLEPERIIQPMLSPEERKQFSTTLNVALSGNWNIKVSDIDQRITNGIGIVGDPSNVHINFLNPNQIQESIHDISHIVDNHAKYFIGRDAELQVLVHFTQQRTPGYLVIEAPPGFGKTALLANLIHHVATNSDLAGVQLFHHFVQQTGRLNTAKEFLQDINSQLLRHLGDSSGLHTEVDSLRNQLRELWKLVVDQATDDTPLLLLIDDLDQMADKDISIITEPLAYLAEYGHIICTIQSYNKLKSEVGRDHPLRSKPRKISLERLDASDLEGMQSYLDLPEHRLITLCDDLHQLTQGDPIYIRHIHEKFAKRARFTIADVKRESFPDVREYYQEQIEQLDELPNRELIWQILGILCAAKGGVTAEELTEVLNSKTKQVAAARSTIKHLLVGDERLTLLHELVRQEVQAALPDAVSLQAYEQKLLDWCRSYHTQEWPGHTPRYVLYHYASHLEAIGDRKSLYALANRRWMELKWEKTNGHNSFAHDMEVVMEFASSAVPVDWAMLVRSCLARATVITFAANLPQSGIWSTLVYVGEIDKACQYANLIPNPSKQDDVQYAIIEACIEVGELATALVLTKQRLQALVKTEDEANISVKNQVNLIQRLQSALQPIKLAKLGKFERPYLYQRKPEYRHYESWIRYVDRLERKTDNRPYENWIRFHVDRLEMNWDARTEQAKRLETIRDSYHHEILSCEEIERERSDTYSYEVKRFSDMTYLEEQTQKQLHILWSSNNPSYGFSHFIEYLVVAGNTDGFQHILNAVAFHESGKFKALVLSLFAKTLVQYRQVEWALKTANKVPYEYQWYAEYSSILTSITTAAILEDKLQFVPAVLQCAWSAEDKADTMSGIAKVLAIYHNVANVRQLADIALKFHQLNGRHSTIGNEQQKLSIRHSYYSLLHQEGKVQEAISLVQKLWNEHLSFDVTPDPEWLYVGSDLIIQSGQLEYLSIIESLAKSELTRLATIEAESNENVSNLTWKQEQNQKSLLRLLDLLEQNGYRNKSADTSESRQIYHEFRVESIELLRQEDKESIADYKRLSFSHNILIQEVVRKIIIHVLSAKSTNEALPQTAEALQNASRFSRGDFLEVLYDVRYWFAHIDKGETLLEIYQAVEEIESWWSYAETIKDLEAQLFSHDSAR